jgi:hypothetical protein
MPYIINKTNGTQIAVVQDGTIDTNTLNITLVGKNYTGYGETFNENFVKLLENFSNTTAPLKKLTGQLWFDSSVRKIKIYDGTKFKSVSILESQDSKPTGYNAGDLWYNTAESKLYAYTGVGTTWTQIGPLTTKGSASGSIAAVVNKDPSGTAVVLKLVSSGVDAVASSENVSAILAGDDLHDLFPNGLKQGLNLPSNYASVYGISYKPGGGGHILWGTAANALGFVSRSTGQYVDADAFLQRTELSSFAGSINIGNDDGVLIGNGGQIRVHSTATGIGNVTVVGGPIMRLGLNTVAYGTNTNVLNIDGTSGLRVLPNPLISVSLGDTGTGNQFSNLYATTVNATTVNVTTVNATTLKDSNSRVLTSVTPSAGSGISITSLTSTGPSSSFTVNNTGVLSLTGTANRISVSAGTGNVTLNLPQDIHTAAAVSFASVSASSMGITGEVSAGSVLDNGSRVLTIATINSNAVRNVYGTANQVSVSSAQGDVTFSLPQNIHTGASPTFNGLTLSSLSADGDGSQINGTWSLNPGATWQATFADLAERYHADAEYDAGTVLVIGGTNEVTVTTERASLSIAGVVSTAASFKMNYAAGPDETHPYIALAGRLPCKAIGPIAKGDCLVTSSTPGHAEKAQPTDSPLSIIGRALSDLADGETGTVEIKV